MFEYNHIVQFKNVSQKDNTFLCVNNLFCYLFLNFMMKTNGILIFRKIIDILNIFNNSIVGVGLL